MHFLCNGPIVIDILLLFPLLLGLALLRPTLGGIIINYAEKLKLIIEEFEVLFSQVFSEVRPKRFNTIGTEKRKRTQIMKTVCFLLHLEGFMIELN
ncbi:hypothetical protein PRIPAC_97060 [Pristionchus pacificus]|uniref:Uncharacterized protein n=1 Tax=Pristionchus pacificus TaxID=54126 RepID=A0A2A6BD76_PRIPA|nr:hypothetical protein PRIPAC_97060 [Pristionchus pacificus]|eukprot:PDM63796.1 hypothetical protein PRIPAC_49769 [Pristionchus pacificus]